MDQVHTAPYRNSRVTVPKFIRSLGAAPITSRRGPDSAIGRLPHEAPPRPGERRTPPPAPAGRPACQGQGQAGLAEPSLSGLPNTSIAPGGGAPNSFTTVSSSKLRSSATLTKSRIAVPEQCDVHQRRPAAGQQVRHVDGAEVDAEPGPPGGVRGSRCAAGRRRTAGPRRGGQDDQLLVGVVVDRPRPGLRSRWSPASR